MNMNTNLKISKGCLVVMCVIIIATLFSLKKNYEMIKTVKDDIVAESNTISYLQQEKIHSQEEKEIEIKLKSIDFFGVKMQGKYKDIVKKIYSLPVLSLVERRDTITKERKGVVSFYHTVEFCGILCGMNVRCRMKAANEMSIHDLCFITSQTDDDIIHKFVSELKKYYGDPDVSDEQENSYHWYLPSGLAVRARHLHAPDGGWTVYFCY